MTTYQLYKQIIACITMLAIIFYSCGHNADKKETADDTVTSYQLVVQEINVPEPKGYPTDEITISKPEATLTTILLKDDSWYCYTGEDLKTGQYYNREKFRDVLLKHKNTWGDSLVVIIKPSDHVSYAGTVDMLDEMAINSIKRYAIVKLNTKEENHFNVSSGPKGNPGTMKSGVEKIAVEPPAAVKSTVINTDKALIIRMTKDGRIGYKIDGVDPAYKFIADKKSNELKEAIARYKSKYPAGRVFITANKDARVPDFSLVVDALKANNELKYQLLSDND